MKNAASPFTALSHNGIRNSIRHFTDCHRLWMRTCLPLLQSTGHIAGSNEYPSAEIEISLPAKQVHGYFW
jgi:hypothetical protein